MPTANFLPPRLQSKFILLERRIRINRCVRGVAACTLLLTAWFLGAYLVELLVGWNVSGLRSLNAVMCGAMVVGLGTGLIRARNSLSCQQLAALVERQYPDLGERLITTVELRENPAPPHGSADLIRALEDEAAERAGPLEFRKAHSVRATRKLAWATAMLVLVAIVPMFSSDQYVRFGRRLLLAWSPSVYGYTLAVTPSDAFVGRGRSADVQVRLAATERGVQLPTSCTLVYREGDAAPRRLRMESLEVGAFHFTWPAVQESLVFHVEAGELASATYRVEPVDPVALAPDGMKAQVTPPPYVKREVLPPVEHSGKAPFSALQYSRLQFHFAFDRPAQRAFIRRGAADKQQEIPVVLDSGGRGAGWSLLAVEAGPDAATLVLEAEHGIASTYPLPAWSVWIDDAPWFSLAPEFLSGGGFPKSIAPNDVIPIKIVAEDQVGLGRVEIEYRINDAPTLYSALADGNADKRVEVDATWRLQRLVKLGDEVKYRLRVADNRRLARDELPLGDQGLLPRDLHPNVTYLPSAAGGEDRWWSFKVELQAAPLTKQVAAAQRDEFGDWISRIKRQLEQERQQVQKVTSASNHLPALSQEQTSWLAQAHRQNQTNQQELRALGQRAGQVESLQSLARLSLDIARRELGDSDQALAAARTKNLPAENRERELIKANQALLSALQRLADLQKLNELLAKERLDVQALGQLAALEKELAQKAEDLAVQPQFDEQELERVRDEQAKIAEKLEKLAEHNRQMQPALQQLRQAQAKKLAQDAHNLALNQRKLTNAAEAKRQAERKTKFAELGRQQRTLADKLAKFGGDLKLQPATAPFEVPHSAAAKAAEQLREGRVEPALAQQQNVEDALQALAGKLESAAAQDQDLRSIVQKLAQTQQDLHKQLDKLGEELARLTDEQVRERLADITKGQKAVHDAVTKLDVPKNAAAMRKAIEELTGDAAALLQSKETLSAFEKMEKARDALQAWARGLPESSPPPLPKGKESPEAMVARKQANQARQLVKDQHDLRAATQKLLAEPSKASGNSAERTAQKEQVDKLAQELMELSQKAGPEAKQAAKDAAHAAQSAQEAMAQSQAAHEKGEVSRAMQSEAEAASQLSMAGKKMDGAAEAMHGQPQDKDDPNGAAMQQAFQDSQTKLTESQRQLRQQPKQAPSSMQQAAKAMQQLAKQAQQQMASQGSPLGGASPAQSFQPGGASAAAEMLQDQLKAHAGKSWGELPGELRTRIVQDLRARYGDEYAPIIQRYFQQIADVPGAKKSN